MSEVTQVAASMEPVLVSEAANTHILKCIESHAGSTGIRLSVKKTGCSGFSYVLDYVAVPEPDDICFAQADGYVICIAKKSYPFLKGITLDFVKQGINSKFIFKNPNQTGECGCGESFKID